MRERTAETRYTLSINIPTSLYHKLVEKTGRGKIGTFIKEILEEKLIKEEQNQKQEFQKRLIADYRHSASNEKLNKELRSLEQISLKDAFAKLDQAEKNEQS